eukprot:COSAG06_NODE_456_length_15511_cov_7.299312_15_plen_54_part_00
MSFCLPILLSLSLARVLRFSTRLICTGSPWKDKEEEEEEKEEEDDDDEGTEEI